MMKIRAIANDGRRLLEAPRLRQLAAGRVDARAFGSVHDEDKYLELKQLKDIKRYGVVSIVAP
jgi:hypothetical protein